MSNRQKIKTKKPAKDKKVQHTKESTPEVNEESFRLTRSAEQLLEALKNDVSNYTKLFSSTDSFIDKTILAVSFIAIGFILNTLSNYPGLIYKIVAVLILPIWAYLVINTIFLNRRNMRNCRALHHISYDLMNCLNDGSLHLLKLDCEKYRIRVIEAEQDQMNNWNVGVFYFALAVSVMSSLLYIFFAVPPHPESVTLPDNQYNITVQEDSSTKAEESPADASTEVSREVSPDHSKPDKNQKSDPLPEPVQEQQ